MCQSIVHHANVVGVLNTPKEFQRLLVRVPRRLEPRLDEGDIAEVQYAAGLTADIADLAIKRQGLLKSLTSALMVGYAQCNVAEALYAICFSNNKTNLTV